jgi:hypothetical protein
MFNLLCLAAAPAVVKFSTVGLDDATVRSLERTAEAEVGASRNQLSLYGQKANCI